MTKEQYDLFEQPPAHLARGHASEEVSAKWAAEQSENAHYMAAQELIHFTDYLKLNDWQQKFLWPHLKVLLARIKVEERDHIRWFELGYIISAMEIEQIRSRAAALSICKKYGVEL